MANNAAKIQTPQIVSIVAHHVSYDNRRTWGEYTVTLYHWMLSTAKVYTDKPTDKRLKYRRIMHIKSTPTPHAGTHDR
jgi:hypothetical protein